MQFFVEVVRPTVAEYLNATWDRRKACLATLVLWSMVDHHHQARLRFVPGDAGRRRAREAFVARGEAFALLRDVAEATKHAALRGDGEGVYFGQVKGTPRGTGGYGVGSTGYGVAGAWGNRDVYVVHGDGNFSFLEECVREVLAYWGRELEATSPANPHLPRPD